MPRQFRTESPRAICHVMSRGDRKQDIDVDQVDWPDFLKTLGASIGRGI